MSIKVLITGGTGSLSKALTKELFNNHDPEAVRIFSRNELSQALMKAEFSGRFPEAHISYLIGDVRDKDRLKMAMRGCDVVINTAAMKRIEVCDSDPIEAMKTNTVGVANLIENALELGTIKKVVQISTDKAVYPTTIYGSTKKTAEDMMTNANTYTGGRGTQFFSMRYGNVFGSNGSVIQLFKEQAKTGEVTITHAEMTRFWITLPDVARFILSCIKHSRGGEIFIPKMPSARVTDLASYIAPEATHRVTGIRGNEKLHECLLTDEEVPRTSDLGDRYCIGGKVVNRPDEAYYSNTNEHWLQFGEFEQMMETLG